MRDPVAGRDPMELTGKVRVLDEDQSAQQPRARPASVAHEFHVTETVAMIEDPMQYDGQMVSLDGQISRMIDNRAFVIDVAAVSREVVVASRTGVLPVLKKGDKVQVSGTLYPLDHARFELGFQLSDVQVAGEDDRAAIIAESVVPTERRTR